MTFSMSWSNSSGEILTRSLSGSDIPTDTRILQSPTDSLRAIGGTTDFVIDNPLEGIISSEISFFCSWEASGYWFGSKIVMPTDFIHMGYSPYYQIAGAVNAPSSEDDIEWRTPVTDPSMTYVYSSAEDQLPGGLNIRCIPVAGGTTFQLQINVTKT